MSFLAITDISAFKPDPNGASVTIGMFDGLHLGHRQIIESVVNDAKQHNRQPAVVTFYPHPRTIVTPNDVPQLLTVPAEKELLFAHYDLTLLTLQFNETLRNVPAEEFVKTYLLDKLNMKHLIIGPSHTIGKKREGTPEKLAELGKKHGFTVTIVPPVMVGGEPVSSSRVRKAVTDGQFDQVLELLAGEFLVTGTVEKGIGLGKKLGIPTANVAVSDEKLLPDEGIYACFANVDSDKKGGILFIGRNHFNPEPRITVEAHLFDFDRDIYGKTLTVRPVRLIRENRKFSSTNALMEQIRHDIDIANTILIKEKKNDCDKRAESSNCR